MLLITILCLTFLTITSVSPNCDNFGHLIYEDLGCRPNRMHEDICPVSYNCEFPCVENGTCFFRNHLYKANEPVNREDLAGSCDTFCVCGDESRFFCAIIDCAEFFGITIPPGCYRTYKLDSCCSSGYNCPKEGVKIATCEVDGKTYREGELFFPKNSCHKCVCGKGFKGSYVAPYCRRTNCASQIHYAKEYQQKCAPYYGKTNLNILCCPQYWICPKLNEKIIKIEKKPKNCDATCFFGDKTIKSGYGFITEDSKLCVCSIPPLLTCIDS